MHATFGYVSRDALRATCDACGLSVPKTAPKCMTCAAVNMRRASRYHTSRSPTQHTTGASWSADLFGPTRVQSRHGSVYELHLVEYNTKWECATGLRAKSDTPGELETWHTTMVTAGVQPRVLTTDLGGEFIGQAADSLYSPIQVAHRLRAPEAHVGSIGSSHQRLYRTTRPAL